MKAIILGCNGYIGQNLTLYLLSKGVEVQCHDIQDSIALTNVSEKSYYTKLDITDSKACLNIDWNADVIYFFAGLTGTKASIELADRYILTNDLGLNNVLISIVKQAVNPRFIFPSTRLIYKGGVGLLSEEHEKEFKTVYSINKFSGEQLLKIYATFYGLNYTVFRICIPYGNLSNIPFSYGTIGFMLKQSELGSINLFGDGKLRRTFTHVGYIAEVLHNCLNIKESKNATFNIGGEAYSLYEIAMMIGNKYNASIKLVDWPEMDLILESGDTVFDSAKLDNAFKITYNYKFKDWLQST